MKKYLFNSRVECDHCERWQIVIKVVLIAAFFYVAIKAVGGSA